MTKIEKEVVDKQSLEMLKFSTTNDVDNYLFVPMRIKLVLSEN